MTAIAKLLNGFGAGDLFQILRDGTPRTRSELAQLTGFSRPTISLRLDELLSSGLISPVTSAVSTGGRPSARVALNPQARLVAAVDFGATHATVALMDLAGKVLTDERAHREIASGPQASLDWLAETITLLLNRVDRTRTDLLAIGIGVPGPVEHSTGRPSSPPIMPGWDDYDIPGHLQGSFAVPVLVDNDVNVMALGEQATVWPDVQNMVFIKVSTGIGAGIISAGVLQRGEDGSAGDIGHIAIARGADIVCRCGNTGCLEAVAGAPAVLGNLITEGADISSTEQLVTLAKMGDLGAMRALRQAGRDIGEVLNVCVSIMNPALIVVGGALAESNESLMAGIREVVYSRSMPLATQNLAIVAARAGSSVGAIGAGVMAIEYALSPEQIDAANAAGAVAV
jgi:predicted NBD/HSP70 family sugar kinase